MSRRTCALREERRRRDDGIAPWGLHERLSLKALRAAIFASAFLLAAMGPAAAEQRAIFKLIVNEVPKGDIVAVIRPNDLLLPVKDIEDAGIKGFSGKRQIIGGRVFVSLASLTPGIKYEIDLKSVSLKLTSETSLLGSHDVSLRRLGAETGVFSANPSLFVNYGLNMNQQLKPPGASVEVGLSLFGNALLDSTASVESNGTILPGLTSLTVDNRSTMRELIVGDTFVFPSLSLLAGSATVGGLTLRSDFQLDPYFISLPQGSLSGTATTPSTAKVYVNGVLVKTINLQPGVFTLHDIPNPIGTGNTQVVVQNAFGQQQVFSSSYDIAGSALAPGVNDYAATAGAVRSQSGSSISYGQPALSGFWRHGWLSWLTPLVRIEADRDVLSGGGGFTTAIGRSGLTLEGSAEPRPARAYDHHDHSHQRDGRCRVRADADDGAESGRDRAQPAGNRLCKRGAILPPARRVYRFASGDLPEFALLQPVDYAGRGSVDLPAWTRSQLSPYTEDDTHL